MELTRKRAGCNGISKILQLRGFLRKEIRIDYRGFLNNKHSMRKLKNICKLSLPLYSIRIKIRVDNPPDPRLLPIYKDVINLSKDTLRRIDIQFEGNNELEQDVSEYLIPLQYCTNLRVIKLVGDPEMNTMISVEAFALASKSQRLIKGSAIQFYIIGRVNTIKALGDSTLSSIYCEQNEISDFRESYFDEAITYIMERRTHMPFRKFHFDLLSYAGLPANLSFLKLIEGSALLKYEINSKIIQGGVLDIGKVCDALSKNTSLLTIIINNDDNMSFDQFEVPLFQCLQSHVRVKTIKLCNSRVKPIICPPNLTKFSTVACNISEEIFVRPPRFLEEINMENGILNIHSIFQLVELEECENQLKVINLTKNQGLAVFGQNAFNRWMARLSQLNKLETFITVNNNFADDPIIDLFLATRVAFKAENLDHVLVDGPFSNVNNGFRLLFLHTLNSVIEFVSPEYELTNFRSAAFPRAFYIHFKMIHRNLVGLSFEMNERLQFINPYTLIKYSKLYKFGVVASKDIFMSNHYGYFNNYIFMERLVQGLKESSHLKKLVFQWPIIDHRLLCLLLEGMLNVKTFELFVYFDIKNIKTILEHLVSNKSIYKAKLVMNGGVCNILEYKADCAKIVQMLLMIRCRTFLYFPNCAKLNALYNIQELNPAIQFIEGYKKELFIC